MKEPIEIFNGILLISIIIIIIIFFLIGWGIISEEKKIPLSTTPENTKLLLSASNVTPIGGILQSCVHIPCGPGLVCDGNTYTCKKVNGASCSSYAECTVGSYCSGVCTFGPTGTLNANCPCGQNYRCMVVDNIGTTKCKGYDAPCSKPEDCASFTCTGGFCQPGFPNAYPCYNNKQCESGNCSLGFCQPPGITTGNLGASCAGSCTLYSGARCNVNDRQSFACQCPDNNTSRQPGTCVIDNNGLYSACSSTNLCSQLFQCYNSQGPDLQCSSDDCVCKFNYQNPNLYQGFCIEGMEQFSQLCYNKPGFACDADSLCSNGNCGNIPILSSYNFTGPGFDFQGTTDVEMSRQVIPYSSWTAANPNDGPKPKQSISLFDGSSYLIDLNYGLLYQKGTNWSQILPAQSARGQLVAAAVRQINTTIVLLVYYNGNSYQVYSGSNFLQTASFNGGVQRDQNNTALTINYIDISNTANSSYSVLITDHTGNAYLKKFSDINYSPALVYGGPYNGQPIVSTTGPARFYIQDETPDYQNIVYINKWNIFGNMASRIVLFSGALAGPVSSNGLATPVDPYRQLYYKVFSYDIINQGYAIVNNSLSSSVIAILMLAKAYNLFDDSFQFNVAMVYQQGQTAALPYQIGDSFVANLGGAYNIVSIGSCVV